MKNIKYMRLKIITLLLLIPCINSFAANGDNFNGIEKWLNYFKAQGGIFMDVTLFNDASNAQVIVPQNFKNYSLYRMNTSVFDQIVQNQPTGIRVSLPYNGTVIEMELIAAKLTTDNFALTKASSNDIIPTDAGTSGIHFQGYIVGEESTSIVAISIFKNQIFGMISSKNNGNIVIGKLKDDSKSIDKDVYVAYSLSSLPADANSNVLNTMACSTDEGQPQSEEKGYEGGVINRCVNVYIEINYNLYEDFDGSYSGVAAFALALGNESACIYKNDGIDIKVCEIHVWDVPSPYTGGSSTAQLSIFQSVRTSFTGNVAILLDLNDFYGGLAAGFYALSGSCESTYQKECYAGIYDWYYDVPTYSWDVMVFTHEIGHLLGSRHTHACVWNGTSTAIDGCGPAAGYPTEGGCPTPPIPSIGGTIMSYCHLVSVGINFYLGFGPQPGAVIRNNIATSICVTTCWNCPAFWFLYINPSYYNYYGAYDFIQSTTVNIDPPNLEYSAGNYILLNPDFIAQSTVASGFFTAHIGGCNPNPVAYTRERSSQVKNTNTLTDGDGKIEVFPNPTENTVTIMYPCKSAGLLDISIKDVSGRIMYTETISCTDGNTVNDVVDLSKFAPGVYFIDLTQNDQHVVKKIVKLH